MEGKWYAVISGPKVTGKSGKKTVYGLDAADALAKAQKFIGATSATVHTTAATNQPNGNDTCLALKADGTRCQCYLYLVDGFCSNHKQFRTSEHALKLEAQKDAKASLVLQKFRSGELAKVARRVAESEERRKKST